MLLNTCYTAAGLSLPLSSLNPSEFGFPNPRHARLDQDGLLAMGGDLEPERLLAAYANGIFPWFNSDRDDILWWCPDPRGVLVPQDFRATRSLRRTLRRNLRAGELDFRLDQAFPEVISACASANRPGQAGTWITENMRRAYIDLHNLGFAHSVEAWRGDDLVGGLYGVSLGHMFFGESMFSREPDASKCAFAVLCAQLSTWNFRLLDCQMLNPHLKSLGVTEMPRASFLTLLEENDLAATRRGAWAVVPDLRERLNSQTMTAVQTPESRLGQSGAS